MTNNEVVMKHLVFVFLLSISMTQVVHAKYFLHGSLLEHGVSQCCDYRTETDEGIVYSGCHRSSPQACNGFVVNDNNGKPIKTLMAKSKKAVSKKR